VAVLSGRDRGKRGKVLAVYPDGGKALVERINLLKHFERRTRADQPGGIIEREAPIALDKLALVCPRCGKPTRIGYRLNSPTPSAKAAGLSTGAAGAATKDRICRRCQEIIGKP